MRFYLILFLFIVFKSNAQEFPPVSFYGTSDYNAENQNWDISQSENKHIYVANNKGLLEYNGANWKLYESPNSTIQRSVNVLGDRIYSGFYMDFGYWKKNEFGLLDYYSLSKDKIEMIEDEQIWEIFQFKKWVVFQSLNRIYIYNPKTETFKIIESKKVITKMFKVRNDVYFQKLNTGLYKIVNGEAVMVSSFFNSFRIINILDNNKQLIAITESNGFFRLENQEWKAISFKEEVLLKKNSVYSAIQLKDGSFAIGTISNGLMVFDNTFNLNYKINQSSGLANNTVLSLFEDESSNMWLGLDYGINSISSSSPYKIYKDNKGLLGTIYASVVYNTHLYLGTNQGLFYRPLNSNQDFKFIPGTNGQVWCLKIIENTLFCGHNNGTFTVRNGSVNKIANQQGTWDLELFNKDLILQGNYNGLAFLEFENNKWNFKNKIKGFNISSRYFEILDSTIYVNHEYKGVFELELKNKYSSVTVKKVQNIFEKASSSSLLKHHKTLFYANKNGIFVFNNTLKAFEKDENLSQIFTSENYISGKLVSVNNKLWAFTKNNIIVISPGSLTSIPEIIRIPLEIDSRESMIGFENVTWLNNSNYLLGTSFGYIIIDLSKIQNSQIFNQKYSLSINSVYAGVKEELLKPVNLNNGEAFATAQNNIRFNYSIPTFNKYEDVQFSTKLEGFNESWSSWSKNVYHEFTNLPYGDYVFKVKGKVGDLEIKGKEMYSFTINKPWFLSTAMIVFYVLSFVLFSILMHNLYRFYYKKQQVKLLNESKKELTLKELENEQQRMSFENEKLQQDVENKSRELAISTMSLIKKNEFLNEIKDELTAKNDDKQLKKVVSIIDKNINNSNDWDYFQEAFNNADKDFFKKIKNIHPSLTPADLKLCAYLRLNLTSKEIAPLLNISPRSVEVKRYRLRKKMDLAHEASLTNYILEI